MEDGETGEEEEDGSKPNFFLSFIYLFVAALYLRCCTRAFSSFDEPGLLSGCGLRAAHCSGFSCFEAWALGVQASVVMQHGLSPNKLSLKSRYTNGLLKSHTQC